MESSALPDDTGEWFAGTSGNGSRKSRGPWKSTGSRRSRKSDKSNDVPDATVSRHTKPKQPGLTKSVRPCAVEPLLAYPPLDRALMGC